MLARLRRAVPFDAAFWSTVDPTTLLQTRPHQVGIPAEAIPYLEKAASLDPASGIIRQALARARTAPAR